MIKELSISKAPLRRKIFAVILMVLGFVLVYLGNIIVQLVKAFNCIFTAVFFLNWKEALYGESDDTENVTRSESNRGDDKDNR